MMEAKAHGGYYSYGFYTRQVINPPTIVIGTIDEPFFRPSEDYMMAVELLLYILEVCVMMWADDLDKNPSKIRFALLELK